MNAKDASIGSYIMNRGEPYRVMRRENVTVGTHSHSKTKLTVQGMFNGRTEVLTVAHHENLEEAQVNRRKGQVISINGTEVQVMDLDNYETLTATAEKELIDQISEGSTVGFVEFNGSCLIYETRN